MLETENEDLYAMLYAARDTLSEMLKNAQNVNHYTFEMIVESRLDEEKWELARGTSYPAWHEGAVEALELVQRMINNGR